MRQINFLFTLLISISAFSQVGIGTVSPDASSVFDVSSSDKGMLIPRVSLSDVTDTMLDGVNTAATGLLIWNTNAAVTGGTGIGYYSFNGTNWDRLLTTGTVVDDIDWYEEGTTTAPNNIGDDKYTFGNLAIGKNTADYRLEVNEATTTATRVVNVSSNYSDTGILSTIWNETNFSGSNSGRGIYTLMGGAGNGTVTGNYNNIQNSGTGLHNGTINLLGGSGDGIQRGTYNSVSNTGNQVHTGTYNFLSGTGSGTKYGSFNSIPSGTGGTHYGVFSQAMKAGSYAGYFSGNVYVSGVFTNPSDRDMKYGIKETSGVLSKLKEIQVRDYKFKQTEAKLFGFPLEEQTGFIAQELETIFPDLVQEEKLPVPSLNETEPSDVRTIKSVNYLGMVPILTKALQEQQQIIDGQQREIEALKNEIESIKAIIGRN